MSKVQIIRDYYDLINQGKHDDAEAYLHENYKTTYRGTSGTFTHNKTEATKGLEEAHKVAQTETVITEAKEISGKVVVVGTTVVKVKAGAPSDHTLVAAGNNLKGSAAPFKATFEFDGDKIINCESEGEPGGSYECTL